jgi:hypothetical protein
MRHLSAWAVGAVAAAVAIGCGPGKELPDPVSRSTGSSPAGGDTKEQVPATADPAAKAVTDRALKAITQNSIDQLVKPKSSRVVQRGGIQLPNNPVLTGATRRIEAGWPDRARVAYEFKDAVAPTITLGMRGPLAWKTRGPTREMVANPTEVAQTLRTDVLAQHWMLLGLPLAEPGAVVFAPQTETVANRAATTVKFVLPDLPVFHVTFDDQSGLPVRIEYTTTESGQRLRKVLTVTEHKPSGGLLLPSELEFVQNGVLAEKWTVETWEFPDKLDDTLFDAPK